MYKMHKFIFKIIRYSGLPFLFREIIQRKKITILLFHDINTEIAYKVFKYLSRKYNIIDLNNFINICNQKKKAKLPNKSLIITFDDGHKGNYDLIPVLKKYKIQVTIFVCASVVGTNRHYWFKIKHSHYSTYQLKQVSNQQRLGILNKIGFTQEKEYQYPHALSKNQMLQMSPFVNFQSHTLFHPCLPKCTDSEAKNEIFKSKEFLENNFNFNINAISYPGGQYSDREIKLCKEAGYKCGITGDPGLNNVYTDLFRLKRLSVNDTSDMDELIVKASCVWAYFKRVIERKKRT